MFFRKVLAVFYLLVFAVILVRYLVPALVPMVGDGKVLFDLMYLVMLCMLFMMAVLLLRLPGNDVEGIRMPQTCPYCRNTVDADGYVSTDFCTSCGRRIPSEAEGDFAVTFRYSCGWYLFYPEIRVIFGDRMISLHRGEEKRVVFPVGNYCFRFRSSIRRNRIDLYLDRDVDIGLGWNRHTGKLTLKARGGKADRSAEDAAE